MSKATKIRAFDPNSPGDANAQIYGLPFTPDEADIVLVPVPWEVTTSYGGGTSRGPGAIFDASFQVDLFHPDFPELWKRGIAMDKEPTALRQQSDALRKRAERVIDLLSQGGSAKEKARAAKDLKLINAECATMNDWVEARTGHWLDRGKLVGLVGGDHSTPLGFFRALAERNGEFGILHIDAHLDLRAGYEGFTYSHASIMYNALQLKEVVTLTQVGIRDLCSAENEVILRERGYPPPAVRGHHVARAVRRHHRHPAGQGPHQLRHRRAGPVPLPEYRNSGTRRPRLRGGHVLAVAAGGQWEAHHRFRPGGGDARQER